MLFWRFKYGHTYTSMKLFSFFDNVLNQRTSESIHGKSISIICLFIETALSPLQKVENYAILLSNQITPYTLKGIYFSLINPIFPWQSETQEELSIDKSNNSIRSWETTYICHQTFKPKCRLPTEFKHKHYNLLLFLPFPTKQPPPLLCFQKSACILTENN